MEIIPAVANNKPKINSAEFVKLTIFNDVNDPSDISVYTFSSSYKTEVIDGAEYSPMGGLLAVGIQQRDIRVTSADTSITLSGIPATNPVTGTSDNIYVVLAHKIRGSEVEITRGFYNNNYVLSNTAHRFSGIVTSYNLTEDLQVGENLDNFTVTISASSYKSVLENRVAGRKTNGVSWKEFYPTDTSMDNVYSLADQKYDFGKDPVKGAATSSTATNESTTATQSDTSPQS